MTYLKQLLSKLTPATAVSVLVGALTIAASFGLNVSPAQKAAILVFGGALAVVLFAHGITNAFHYLTPPTITGLVMAAIGIAVAFGAPITKAQSESILELTALFGGLLLAHGAVHTLARDRRTPEGTEAPVAGTALVSGVLAPALVTAEATAPSEVAKIVADMADLVKRFEAAAPKLQSPVRKRAPKPAPTTEPNK